MQLLKHVGFATYIWSFIICLQATIIYSDNVSVVYMSSNPVHHQRIKHIEIDLHFVRDKIAISHVCVLHVPSSSQYAYIFTKILPSPLFLDFWSSLNARDSSPIQTAGDISVLFVCVFVLLFIVQPMCLAVFLLFLYLVYIVGI